jgi:hypothetical protein
MSTEYTAAIALMLYGVLKAFGIELPNGTLEGIITGSVALLIAIRRKQRGDIDIIGRRVV